MCAHSLNNWEKFDVFKCVFTCSRSLSSPMTAAVFQSMISEKGSSQPLLSITGTQAAWEGRARAHTQAHKHTHTGQTHIFISMCGFYNSDTELASYLFLLFFLSWCFFLLRLSWSLVSNYPLSVAVLSWIRIDYFEEKTDKQADNVKKKTYILHNFWTAIAASIIIFQCPSD